MIHSIATRKITALLFAMAWLTLVGQGTGYGQPPVAEGKMYWANLERGIYRSSLDGTNIEQLVKPEWSYPGSIALDVAGGKMYWTDRRVSGGIYRSALDGTNIEILLGNKWIETPLGDERIDLGDEWWTLDPIRLLGFDSSTTSIALDVAEGKMYWTEVLSHGDYIDGIVARANLDGSNIEILFEGLYPWDIALDLVRGKVYWTDLDFDGILRSDLDGQNVEYDYIQSGSPMGIALDVDQGKIYWTGWTDAGAILRADLNGQNIEEILTVSDSYPEEITLDVDRGKIYWTNTYWTNTTTQTIQRADLNGENVEYLFSSEGDVKRHLSGPRAGIALDADGGKMYWTDSGPGTIQRADLDGENREILFDPIVREPHGIVLYMDKMYWTDVAKGTIQRADLDGQNIEVLVTGLNRPKEIALLDGDKIYWADAGPGEYWGYSETGERIWVVPEKGKIQAANWDGSNVKDVLTGLSYLEDIALDAIRGKLYWTNTDTAIVEGIIHRADLDGANVEDIVTGMAPFRRVEIALDLDSDKLYWTDQGTGTIQRADLDGTNVEGIFSLPDTDWSSLGAIALDSVGNKIYWGVLASAPSIDPIHTPAPRWLEIFRSNLDGSQVKEIYYGFRVEGYSPAQTSIALYIPHPTSISTPATPSAIPATSSLSPNYPNPFNASTPVRLTIYNTLGQPVRTLVDQVQDAGFYQVRWDTRDQRGTALAAGVYLVRLHYPDGEQTRRLLLLK